MSFFGQQEQQQALPWMQQPQPQPIVPQMNTGSFVGAGSINPQATSFTGYQDPTAGQQFSGATPGEQGNWFNDGTMQGIGSTMQGLGALGGIGMGFMQLRDLRKAREQSQANFERNYAAQRTTTNNEIARKNEARRKMGSGSGNIPFKAKLVT